MRRIATIVLAVSALGACGGADSESCGIDRLEQPVVSVGPVDSAGGRHTARLIEPTDRSDTITDAVHAGPGSGAFVATRTEDDAHRLSIVDGSERIRSFDLGGRVPVALDDHNGRWAILRDGDRLLATEWDADGIADCNELGVGDTVHDVGFNSILVRDGAQVRQYDLGRLDEPRDLDLDGRDVAQIGSGRFVGAAPDRFSLYDDRIGGLEPVAIVPVGLLADVSVERPAEIVEVLVVEAGPGEVEVVAVVHVDDDASVLIGVDDDGRAHWRREMGPAARAVRVGAHQLLVQTRSGNEVVDVRTGTTTPTDEAIGSLFRGPQAGDLVRVTDGAGAWITVASPLGPTELTVWRDGVAGQTVTIELDRPRPIEWVEQTNGHTVLGLDRGRGVIVIDRIS